MLLDEMGTLFYIALLKVAREQIASHSQRLTE